MIAPVILVQYLAEAERHVKSGRDILAVQRQLIARLEKGGRNAKAQKAMLGLFEQIQRSFLARRNRILKDLDI